MPDSIKFDLPHALQLRNAALVQSRDSLADVAGAPALNIADTETPDHLSGLVPHWGERSLPLAGGAQLVGAGAPEQAPALFQAEGVSGWSLRDAVFLEQFQQLSSSDWAYALREEALAEVLRQMSPADRVHVEAALAARKALLESQEAGEHAYHADKGLGPVMDFDAGALVQSAASEAGSARLLFRPGTSEGWGSSAASEPGSAPLLFRPGTSEGWGSSGASEPGSARLLFRPGTSEGWGSSAASEPASARLLFEPGTSEGWGSGRAALWTVDVEGEDQFRFGAFDPRDRLLGAPIDSWLPEPGGFEPAPPSAWAHSGAALFESPMTPEAQQLAWDRPANHDHALFLL